MFKFSEGGWSNNEYFNYVFYGPKRFCSWSNWIIPGTINVE